MSDSDEALHSRFIDHKCSVLASTNGAAITSYNLIQDASTAKQHLHALTSS